MYNITAASNPIGSEIFSLVAILVISLVVLLILRYYLPLRTTPAYLLVPVFLALSLPASIVLLVPIDLASSARTDTDGTRGIWLPYRVLLVSWRITYWLTFVLTWFILPILAEYSDAGYRDAKGRLLYSLRSNGQYQAIVFGSGILGLIYFGLTRGVNVTSLQGIVMALAYCFGLILAIYLMGHGLVAIPRSLFRNSSISGRLRRIQSHAPKVHEQMEEAIYKMEDFEAQIAELSRRATGSAKEFKEWIEELVDTTGLPESKPRSLGRRMSMPVVNVPVVITERYLADLTRHLNRARHSRIRFINEWDRLVQDATATQAILDSAGSKRLEIGKASPQASFLERFTLFTPYTRYLYYSYVVPYTRIFFGALLAIASACIIWSELIKVHNPNFSVIRFTVIHHPGSDQGQIGVAGQVVAALWILYMCAAALTSITEVKVWRGRALVRRNTASESAFWYAYQVARLTVPLAYNFVTFLPEKVYKATVFYEFLGLLIDFTPLGEWFNVLFPIFILVPVSATLFNLYGKIKRLFGFGNLIDDDDEENTTGYGTGSWREGRDLIEREVNGHSSLARLRDPEPRTASPAAPTTRSSSSTTAPHVARAPAASRPTVTPQQRVAEPEDENFFEAFGHRVRNTLDTMQTPKWLQEGLKKPKWMGGDGDAETPARSGSGSSFTRMFGGGSREGQVRL